MLHGLPRADNYGCNVCAFCHYWEGNAQLHSHGFYQVEFNERTKGRCLSIGGVPKPANYSACSRFQMSNEASKYVKR
ncbi:hypothetical protein AMURIS_01486 [Acetatifactor muris]|uniref:Uncharacterized protein n=1 Tax=Acetatifactor muris TaxID=879566 RepID=A0A2K4ZE80_9FIRM|nr:hypothetical protein AMURIS_01486 [Acetatifactor muris]